MLYNSCLLVIHFECSSVYMTFSSVQFSSVAQSCPTLGDPMDCSSQASLSITNSWRLCKLMSITSVMPSNHLILSRPFLLPPSNFLSITVLSSELILHIRWPKYWSFSFSIGPSSEYSGLISFRMDWLDLLAVPSVMQDVPYRSRAEVVITKNTKSKPRTYS